VVSLLQISESVLEHRSEIPIISGAGQPVRGSGIYLSDACVASHHLERGVAQELLEDKEIAAIPQKGDGKGVAEEVRVAVHTCPLADAFEKAIHDVAREGTSSRQREEGSIGLRVISGGEIGREGDGNRLGAKPGTE
jgi:hypothetical protein